MPGFNANDYIPVSERIEKFYAAHSKGRILTAIVEHVQEAGFILMRAEVFREPDDALPAATGHAYEMKSAGHVQAGSYIEVCETSCVGRALANLGLEVKRQNGQSSRGGAREARREAAPARGRTPLPPAARRSTSARGRRPRSSRAAASPRSRPASSGA